MTTYRNPVHRRHDPMYGPEFYQTDAKPVTYKGHLIYHRTELVWDVVLDGVCLTNRAGPNGARRFIDELVAV